MLIIVSCFTIIACKKGDSTNSSIVGRWEERHDLYTETDTSVSPASVFRQDTTYATGHGEILEFGSSGEYKIRNRPPSTHSDTGTYTFTNNTLTIQFAGRAAGSESATVSGNDLVITFDFTGGSIKYHSVTNYVRL